MMSDLFQLNEVEVEPTDGEREASFLLQRMEIYNWGPFSGMHREAEIDPGGTAIIGATGSGKTTLVDALMTLLVAFPGQLFGVE